MLQAVARPDQPFVDDDKAEVIRQVVSEITEEFGDCTARRLYEHARDPKSPLHNGYGFVWNAELAAEMYNLSVARRRLRAVGTYVRGPDGETLLTPMWEALLERRTGEEEEDDPRYRDRPLVQINECRKSGDAGLRLVQSVAASYKGRRAELAYVSDKFDFLPPFLEALDSFLASVEAMAEEVPKAAG